MVFPQLVFAPECPYRGRVIRRNVKRIVDELEKHHPGIRYQILESSERLGEVLRKDVNLAVTLSECRICGEPSSSEVCNACQLREQIEGLPAVNA